MADQRLPAWPGPDQRHRRDTPVWVDVAGAWRPGVVLTSSARAATIRYRLPGAGTGVDTVLWSRLAAAARAETDPVVDRPDPEQEAGT